MLFKKREFVVKCNVGLNSDVHTTQIYYIHNFGVCYLREETLLSSVIGLNCDVSHITLYYIHKFGMCYLTEGTLSSAMLVGIVKLHI